MSWDCQTAINISNTDTDISGILLPRENEKDDDRHFFITQESGSVSHRLALTTGTQTSTSSAILTVFNKDIQAITDSLTSASSLIGIDRPALSNIKTMDTAMTETRPMPSLEAENDLDLDMDMDDGEEECLDGFKDAIAEAEAKMNAMLSSFDIDIFSGSDSVHHFSSPASSKKKKPTTICFNDDDDDDTDDDAPVPAQNPAASVTVASSPLLNVTACWDENDGMNDKDLLGDLDDEDSGIDTEEEVDFQMLPNNDNDCNDPVTPFAAALAKVSQFETPEEEQDTATTPAPGQNPANDFNSYSVAKNKAFSPYDDDDDDNELVVPNSNHTNIGNTANINVTLDMDIGMGEVNTDPEGETMTLVGENDPRPEVQNAKEDSNASNDDDDDDDSFLPTTSFSNETLPLDLPPEFLAPPSSIVESPSPCKSKANYHNGADVSNTSSSSEFQLNSQDSDELLLAFLPNTGKDSFTTEELTAGRTGMDSDSAGAAAGAGDTPPPKKKATFPTPAASAVPRPTSSLGPAHRLLQQKGRIKETPKSTRGAQANARGAITSTSSTPAAKSSSDAIFTPGANPASSSAASSSAAIRARARAKIASRNATNANGSANKNSNVRAKATPTGPPRPSGTRLRPSTPAAAFAATPKIATATTPASETRQARIHAASERVKSGAVGIPLVRKRAMMSNDSTSTPVNTNTNARTMSRVPAKQSAQPLPMAPSTSKSSVSTISTTRGTLPVSNDKPPPSTPTASSNKDKVEDENNKAAPLSPVAAAANPNSTEAVSKARERVRDQMREKRHRVLAEKEAAVRAKKSKAEAASVSSASASRPSSSLFQPTAAARIRVSQTTVSVKKPKPRTVPGGTSSRPGASTARRSAGVGAAAGIGVSARTRSTTSRLTRPTTVTPIAPSSSRLASARNGSNKTKSTTASANRPKASAVTKVVKGEKNDTQRSNSVDDIETASSAPTEIHSNHSKDKDNDATSSFKDATVDEANTAEDSTDADAVPADAPAPAQCNNDNNNHDASNGEKEKPSDKIMDAINGPSKREEPATKASGGDKDNNNHDASNGEKEKPSDKIMDDINGPSKREEPATKVSAGESPEEKPMTKNDASPNLRPSRQPPQSPLPDRPKSRPKSASASGVAAASTAANKKAIAARTASSTTSKKNPVRLRVVTRADKTENKPVRPRVVTRADKTENNPVRPRVVTRADKTEKNPVRLRVVTRSGKTASNLRLSANPRAHANKSTTTTRPSIAPKAKPAASPPKRSLTKEVKAALAKRKAAALQRHKDRSTQSLARRSNRKSHLPPAPSMEEVLGHAMPSSKKGHCATPTANSKIRLEELATKKKEATDHDEEVDRNSKPRNYTPTIPHPPRLSTTERNGERVYSCASHLDHIHNGSLPGSRPTSPDRSHAGSVRSVAKDFKDLSLAQCVGDYFAKSLRGDPSALSSYPSSPVRSHNGLTVPKTPTVLKRSAIKKTPKFGSMIKTRQEEEEEQVNYCQSHQFKARPVPGASHRPPVSHGSHKTSSSAVKAPKPPTTKSRPFRLSLDSRRVAPMPPSIDDIELSKQFKARVAPSSTHKAATIKSSTPLPRKPMRPPRLSTSSRTDKRKASIVASEHRAAALMEEKKASEQARRRHEADKLRAHSPSAGGGSVSSRGRNAPTIPVPFRLQSDARGELHHEQQAERFEYEEEQRRQSSTFKALALPKPKQPFVPLKGQAALTEPKPFNLLSEERHIQYRQEMELKLEEEEELKRQLAEGRKATPIPKSLYVEDFFAVKPSEVGRPKVVGKWPEFMSDKQHERRKQFDQQVKERTAQQEQLKQQQLDEQKRQEDEEDEELRRMPVSQGGYQVEAKPINAVFQEQRSQSRNRSPRSRSESFSTLSTYGSASPMAAQLSPDSGMGALWTKAE
jgi:hypothetical protein